MKKIDFRQRAAKTEERKRKSKYADVMVRATVMGLMKPDEDVDRMMDIESADKKFNMRLDEWLNADDFNFAHDFYGIVNNINREKGFPATDFGFWMVRAGRNLPCGRVGKSSGMGERLSGQEPDTRGTVCGDGGDQRIRNGEKFPGCYRSGGLSGQKRMGASAQSAAGNRNSNKGHHQRVHKGTERVPV